MPYLDEHRKAEIDGGQGTLTSGDLTYAITKVVIDHLLNKSQIRYADLCDVAGALINSYSEFYRSIVEPYENAKIEQNGDVYEQVVGKIFSSLNELPSNAGN